MDRLARLTALFRRRWACPVLAQLHLSQGAKFVTLVHRLECNPGAMRQALDELIDLGWVRRNPGYGHPMRPEYLLTARGERLGPACAGIESVSGALGLHETVLRKWSMPVLYLVGEGPTRFTQVTRALGGITDRAASLALKDLTRAAMVARTLIEGPPAGSQYGATPIGEQLLPVLDRV
ncbi:HTH-type transcriptional activator HxlR [Phycisphaerales bacterium]|nr:HTH-type transcriptional activator HxlR [Phycisphaerales bacterium]